MAGNRKLPFGYKMEFGTVVIHPLEAPLVVYIYRQYAAGTPYSILVTELNKQPVRYDGDKEWNKHMVARILKDERYTGKQGYPVIIADEEYMAAQTAKSEKQVSVQQTEIQKLIRQLSRQKPTKTAEKQLLSAFDRLINNPELIAVPQVQEKTHTEEYRLQRELDGIMNCHPIDEDAALQVIMALAAEQYRSIGSEEYETQRLHWILDSAKSMGKVDADLIRSVVSEIHIHCGELVGLRLKNNQIIERMETNE